MCFKDAICLRKILLKMALDTVLDGGDGELAHVPVHGFFLLTVTLLELTILNNDSSTVRT
jgi:hypothetical protein